MSKKYKNKICAYCGVPNSTTVDHVFPRALFHENDASVIPKVPACFSCNNEKSKLEHTLSAVLPFGAKHEHALQNLCKKIPRMLKKNVKLHKKLQYQIRNNPSWENGDEPSTLTLPEEISKINEFIKYTVKGLSVWHWETYLTTGTEFEFIPSPVTYKDFYSKTFLTMQCDNKISDSLGKGTISYLGMQNVQCPLQTIWFFELLGGLQIADSRYPDKIINSIGVITKPVDENTLNKR